MIRVKEIVMGSIVLSGLVFALSNNNLNICEQERTLSQEMLKEVFLIKSNIDKQDNIKKLSKDSKLFDKMLKGLLSGDKSLRLSATKNLQIKEQLKKVLSIWNPLYQNLEDIQKGKEENKYSLIRKKSEELLKELDNTVKLYAKKDKKENFKLSKDMDLAIQEKILLEKMAISILSIKDRKESKSEFLKSKKLFSKILKGLYKGDKKLKLKGTKLSTITKELKNLNELWSSQNKILQQASDGKDIQKAIKVLDNLILESDKLIAQYKASFDRYRQRDEFNYLVKIYSSLETMDNQTKKLLQELAKTEIK